MDQETVQKIFGDVFYGDDDFTLLIPDGYLEKFLAAIPNASDVHRTWRGLCFASMFGEGEPPGDRVRTEPGAGFSKPADTASNIARLSFEFQALVHGEYARLQVSRAYAGRAWTATVRWTAPRELANSDFHQIGPGYASRADQALANSKWRPDRKYAAPDGRAFLFSFDDLVKVTGDLIFKSTHGSGHGLVLLTGRTASGKSQVARGLVWRLMQAKAKGKPSRRPHLVTYEDPVEEYFVPVDELLESNDPRVIERERAIDYTPRQKHRDCYSLAEVVSGALRQTPTALYIGEIRTDDEFVDAMRFAGTGHLVVATAHAGNLVESVGKVLDAVDAHDASARAMYVPRILAVVHMAKVSSSTTWPSEPNSTLSGLVPAIYRRTTRGMQNLIADGLFSLMPGYSRNPAEIELMGSLGRQCLADELSRRVSAKSDDEFRDDLGQLLAPRFSPRWWRRLAAWNRGDNSEPFPSGGRRLIDSALGADIHGE